MKRRVSLAVAAAITLAAGDAVGDVETVVPCDRYDNAPCVPDTEIVVDGVDATVVWHLHTWSTVKTDGGSELRLPPGYFLPEPAWEALDIELRRAQDAETRLAAENASLRESARSGAPWWAIGLGVVVGAAAGVYVYERVR